MVSDVQQASQLFGQDVRWRVLLELLRPDVDDAQQAQRLDILDQRLRIVTRQERFIWPVGLEGAFPSPRFWFLYLGFREK